MTTQAHCKNLRSGLVLICSLLASDFQSLIHVPRYSRHLVSRKKIVKMLYKEDSSRNLGSFILPLKASITASLSSSSFNTSQHRLIMAYLFTFNSCKTSYFLQNYHTITFQTIIFSAYSLESTLNPTSHKIRVHGIPLHKITETFVRKKRCRWHS